jgi:hypothetical protein
MKGDDDDRSGLRVRPYAITGGRTRSATEVQIETIVVRTAKGEASLGTAGFEKATILRLCETPQSVAEVSAHLRLPLGVTRVLVGDMTDEGLVDFNRSQAGGDRPSLRLLERVFDGLQAL